MTEFWKIAASVAGIGAVGSFVFFSLYKKWLDPVLLNGLTRRQRFILFVCFLFLTFGFGIAAITAYVLTDTARTEVRMNRAQSEAYRNMLQQRFDTGIQILNERRAEIKAGPRTEAKAPKGGSLIADITESVPNADEALRELDLIESDYRKHFERIIKCCDVGDIRGVHDNAKAFLITFSEQRLQRVFSNTVVTRLRIMAGVDVKPKTETKYQARFNDFIESLVSDITRASPTANKALLDNGRGAYCHTKAHCNLNITRFVHVLRHPSRARA